MRSDGAAAAITSPASKCFVSFQINGLVDGETGKAGLFVTINAPITVARAPYAGASVGYCFSGSTQTNYPMTSASATVAAGGTVTGAQGMLIRRKAANTNG